MFALNNSFDDSELSNEFNNAGVQSVGFQTLDAPAFFYFLDTLPPTEIWANPVDSEIRFDDEILLFGEAEEGDEILAEFIFTNIGTRPLELELVSACDCIRVEWPNGEILPGEAAQVTAAFDTTGRAGEKEKTLDVIFKNRDFNGYPLVKQVMLKGTIVPK